MRSVSPENALRVDALEEASDGSFSKEEILRSGPLVHLLSNGALTTAVSAAGAAQISFGNLAVNAWRPDSTVEPDGYFLYIRDLVTGRFWSAGLRPCADGSKDYCAHFEPERVRLVRIQEGIRSTQEIRVSKDLNVEIRQVTLRNETDAVRRLDVTSYVEVALNEHNAHAAHPAFSKLFVQTAFDPGKQAIYAWRRRRSPDESLPRLLHFASGDGETSGFETSRPDFLGRGRHTHEPVALTGEQKLRSVEGSVLDPILAVRRELQIGPGEEASISFYLGVAWSAEGLEEIFRRCVADAEALRNFDASADAGALQLDDASGSTDSPRQTATSSRPHARNVHSIVPIARRADKIDVETPPQVEALAFDNGYGGFTAAGDEYVIRLPLGPDGRPALPPQPWTNVIANDVIGFIVSEAGAGCTWAANSRKYRLTPWSNDPVTDPPGEAFYVRDEDAGQYWSLMAGPAPAPTAYEARHGLGYTTFRHSYDGLQHTTTQFVARDDPVKITLVRLRNLTDEPRTISVFGYHDLVLGQGGDRAEPSITAAWSSEHRALLARNPDCDEFSDRVAFVAARGASWEQFVSTDRRSFLGRFGRLGRPRALEYACELEAKAEVGDDLCAALQMRTTIPARSECACVFLLGSVRDETHVDALIRSLEHPPGWNSALEDAKTFWVQLTDRLQIHTPEPEIDAMVNRWLPYQNLSCRMRGRSAFYQSGGAFGFRDQLQDAAALVYLDPDLTRRQILLHAEKQFTEGDVLHWWHPPTGKGIRTHFSDDLLWLPYVTAFYVRTTGDASILDEVAGFLTGRALESGEDEASLVACAAGESASVYEHVCRALDRSLTMGAHGLPLMGSGDWNDGMNRVGRLGRGESVWLGFFIHHILNRFIPVCSARGDGERVVRYAAYREQLSRALNDAGWDGEWYRRAFYDNGDVLGSSQSDECRIDALVQAWAVISGVAPKDRANRALDAMEQELVDEEAGIIRLLTPPFDNTRNDPGYIKGYVPGVRENGGQYTHGALWAVRALAEAGRGARATALLKMLSPINHTKSAENVARYRVEPYVIAADVYGEPPYVGRGGWTWYTGSAGWMCRVAIESVLGFHVENGQYLTVEPSIPESWDEYSMAYRIPGSDSLYRIRVINPDRHSCGVRGVTLDGAELPSDGIRARIPVLRDGMLHEVEVVM